MKLQAFELPKACSMSNGDLQRTINNLRRDLLAQRRPEHARGLTRREWARDKAQMRFQLGMYSELLDLRVRIAKARDRRKVKPLPNPVSGFDSDLLTPQEIAAMRMRCLESSAAYMADGSPSAAVVGVLPLLTAVCEARRAQ